MAKELHVEGYDALTELMNSNESCKGAEKLFVLFCGSVNSEGVSWCPDCVVAEPVVAAALKEMDEEGLVLVHCGVGERAFWKDPKNIFRTDPKLKLRGVPTLLNWKRREQRLVEDQCAKIDTVKMLFEGDDFFF